jgi:glucosamine 6-phosphate synthetase-like amidotransferase/phosphosugar isomerase protein
MGAVMSQDKSHQDGLGYAGIDSAGNLFAERWLTNSEAFKVRPSMAGEYADFLQVDYSSYGDVNLDDLTAITLHTRLATSGKGLHNCHPFIENDTSVIHNGVIHNHNKFRIEQSSCDSEAILTQYVDNSVGDDPELFDKMSTQLDGYYACGIFARTESGERILDVVKSASAVLIGAFIKELDTMVFTSLESHLMAGIKLCGFDVPTVFKVKNSSLVRINPLTGKVLGNHSFVEIERKATTYPVTTGYSRSYADRYDWDNDDWYKSYRTVEKTPSVQTEQKKVDSDSEAESKLNDPFFFDDSGKDVGYHSISKKKAKRLAKLKMVKG